MTCLDIVEHQLGQLFAACAGVPDEQQQVEQPIMDDFGAGLQSLLAADTAGPRRQAKDRFALLARVAQPGLALVLIDRCRELAEVDRFGNTYRLAHETVDLAQLIKMLVSGTVEKPICSMDISPISTRSANNAAASSKLCLRSWSPDALP